MLQHLLSFSITIALVGCAGEKSDPSADTRNSKPSEQADTTVMAHSVPHFDGVRAFNFLTAQTDFGPRNPNSPGHQACLEYLYAELKRSADEVRMQPFLHTVYNDAQLHLTNIFAVYNKEAAARVLLLAHWDTRPRAEHDENKSRRNEPILGANDGASGVAVLLEIASLMASERPRIGIDILLVDGEDYGLEGDNDNYLLGSRHFARNRPPDYVPRFGILLDMVGDRFLEIPKEQHSVRYAPDIVDLIWNKAKELGYGQFVDAPGESVIDDHLPLNETGIKTVDIIDFNYPDPTNRFWHSHQDIPANCSAESLEAVGTVVTHVVYTQSP